MNIAHLVLTSGIILFLAYRWYGRFVTQRLRINDAHRTPAHTHQDGVDYVPSHPAIVLGHHFASIAGAGPIVGPVIAASFGWIPAFFWILFGGIFVGAVHDMTSLVASLRHDGRSIGWIIREEIGEFGKKLFLTFSFSALILVIGVFTNIIAKTFVKVPEAATASLLFMALAIVFGFAVNRLKMALPIATILGVTAMFLLIPIGNAAPLCLTYHQWIFVLLVYVFIAAVTPVWILLQPRDYLNSYLLYSMMLLGIIGICVARPSIMMTAMPQFHVDTLGPLFPVLFVTIACGATSGFHSLVASGTTAKQINKESHAKIVGFGGMLIESFLAVMALGTVMILSRDEYMTALKQQGPVSLFSEGLGGFIASLGIPATLTVPFVALTVSAFALTTLDTCTRLARFSFQEYFEGSQTAIGKICAQNRYIGTSVAMLTGAAFVYSDGLQALWPVFGSANQLLAALALLAVSVWLAKCGVNNLFTIIPMIFMFIITLSSLALFAWKNVINHSYLLGLVAFLLFLLAITLLWLAKKSRVTAHRGRNTA